MFTIHFVGAAQKCLVAKADIKPDNSYSSSAKGRGNSMSDGYAIEKAVKECDAKREAEKAPDHLLTLSTDLEKSKKVLTSLLQMAQQ